MTSRSYDVGVRGGHRRGGNDGADVIGDHETVTGIQAESRDGGDEDTAVLARAESARGEVVLRRRGHVLELRVNGVFVMDTAETSTELALATTALAAVDRAHDVLLGGLGLGFTAHEVLADHGVERLVVVEIEPTLIRWMRDGTVPHGPGYLADERLTIVEADLRIAVAEAHPESYDLVLLDVDNGPGYLVHDENAAVYGRPFLTDLSALLRPGGALAIWSAARSDALSADLSAVFGGCDAIPHPVVLGERDETYWLYLSRKEPS